MKSLRLSFTALLLVMATDVAAPGAIIQQKDSADFLTQGCEGNSVSCPATVVSSAGFVPDGVGDYLFSNATNGHLGQINTFLDSVGWTIEARVKVVTASTPTVLIAQMSAGDDTPGFYQMNFAQSQFSGISPTTAHDFTQWTVARMAKEALTDQVRVWLDGVDLGLFNPSNATLQRNQQIIGDGTSATGGQILIDYIRSDYSGAYAPVAVPEPTGILLSLLGFLICGLMKRTR